MAISGTSMSEDGLFCVECLNTTKKMNRIEKCPNCASGEITAFSLAANMQFMQQICQKCPENSRPSFDKRICIPCSKADLLSCSCQVGFKIFKNFPLNYKLNKIRHL